MLKVNTENLTQYFNPVGQLTFSTPGTSKMEEGRLHSSLRGLEVCPKKGDARDGGSWRETAHQGEVWEPKYPVLSADPSSSERGLPCCSRSPHSCSRSCRVKGGGGRPRLAGSVRGGTTRPPAALGPGSCSLPGPESMSSCRPPPVLPPNPLQERPANPVTAAEATPRKKRRSAEDPRKEEGARSLPRDRQMWGS